MGLKTRLGHVLRTLMQSSSGNAPGEMANDRMRDEAVSRPPIQPETTLVVEPDDDPLVSFDASNPSERTEQKKRVEVRPATAADASNAAASFPDLRVE